MAKFSSGSGAQWLDLLATRRGRYRAQQSDEINTPAALRAWLRENALEPGAGVTEADVSRADAVREALHRLAAAALRGVRPRPADVRTVEETLRADRGLRVLAGDDGLALDHPATTAEALARLAREAAQDLAGPRRAHLRGCGDDTCGGIFLDYTGRRRWCSDEICGNRVRVQAHRARVRRPGG